MSEFILDADEFQDYPVLDLKMPELPPRSFLYSLPPIGIATGDVESLSGYISRLAFEHRLSPVVLLKNASRNRSELPKWLLQDSISSDVAAGLNGFGSSAKTIVELLERATFRKDIRATCLLPFRNKLSSNGLLRKHLAWCPLCYEKQREYGKIIYEKLAWTINLVKACAIHRIPLSESCPHCLKKLKVLSGRSRPGFCSKCLVWLGSKYIPYVKLNRFRDFRKRDTEMWKAERIREFLERSSLFYLLENNAVFIENLERIIQVIAGGSINDFAQRTRMWHIAVRRLLKAEVTPTLEMIFAISQPLEISPLKLFEENGFSETGNIVDKNESKEPFAKTDMGKYLEGILSESPPPSANEVERRTGWSTERLKRNFPDEYKLIVKRYAESVNQGNSKLTDAEVEQVLVTCQKENPPPPLQAIFRRIGCRHTGYRYYQKFPELCKKITTRYKNHRKRFDLKKAKKIAKECLSEKPPPSFSEVARRINCTRNTLNANLPELSKLLNENYKRHLEKQRESNRIELYKTLDNIITDLRKNKLPISENQVKKQMPRKWNDKTFKSAYREITASFIG